jgi:hypothetical protein
MVDIMELEYTFCRNSRRCDVADCVTVFVVSIKFRFFSIVYLDVLMTAYVFSGEKTETHEHGERHTHGRYSEGE